MPTTDITECSVRNDKLRVAGFFLWSWLTEPQIQYLRILSNPPAVIILRQFNRTHASNKWHYNNAFNLLLFLLQTANSKSDDILTNHSQNSIISACCDFPNSTYNLNFYRRRTVIKFQVCILLLYNISCRLRWTSGQRARHWTQGSRVRSRPIKIRSTTSFGGEVKPSVSCRRFTACKRTLRAWIEMFRKQNSKPPFLTQVSWLPARWLWRSHQDRQNSSAASFPVTIYGCWAMVIIIITFLNVYKIVNINKSVSTVDSILWSSENCPGTRDPKVILTFHTLNLCSSRIDIRNSNKTDGNKMLW
jgi:hypothetical protein